MEIFYFDISPLLGGLYLGNFEINYIRKTIINTGYCPPFFSIPFRKVSPVVIIFFYARKYACYFPRV